MIRCTNWAWFFHSTTIRSHRTGVGAYRIRPDVSGNETTAANTSPSSAVHLRPCGGRMRYAPTVLRYREMMQKRLEATSSPNCTLRKHALKQLQVQIVHCTRPFLHCSMPFCTRRKAPWTHFKAFLYTCKPPWTNFKTFLYTCNPPWTNFKTLLYTCKIPLN